MHSPLICIFIQTLYIIEIWIVGKLVAFSRETARSTRYGFIRSPKSNSFPFIRKSKHFRLFFFAIQALCFGVLTCADRFFNNLFHKLVLHWQKKMWNVQIDISFSLRNDCCCSLSFLPNSFPNCIFIFVLWIFHARRLLYLMVDNAF